MSESKCTIVCACPHCRARGPADDWERVEGEWYCPDCADYAVDIDGQPLCATHDVPDEIEWGPIVTGRAPGCPAYQIGRDRHGRRWITEDRGGWTVPRPIE